MPFLDAFDDADRNRMLAASDQLQLGAGQALLRRGEAGGDVYVVEQGELEVVDSRRSPEVILLTLGPGAMVGEMSFLDQSPRSADVRARSASTVRRWVYDDLHALVDRHPTLAATLYKTLALQSSDRVRRMTEGAAAGAFGNRRAPQADTERAEADARTLADRTKESLLSLEARSRGDRRELDTITRDTRAVLDRLEEDVRKVFTGMTEPDAVTAAAAVLARELRPFVGRSTLADKCLRRPQGYAASGEILAHVLVNTATGDGLFGEIVDRWLLDRPSLGALRALRNPVLGFVQKVLPSQAPRVLVVNAGPGALSTSLAATLAEREATLTVMDQNRDALSFLEAEETTEGAEIFPIVENLAALAAGRGRQRILTQDVAIVDGLIEYLPERLASGLVAVIRSVLRPGGTLVVTTLSPSADRDLLDHVFAWPTVRRTRAGVQGLLVSAGLSVTGVFEPFGPALVAAGKAPGG